MKKTSNLATDHAKLQANYFNQESNRFTSELLLNPTKPQRDELTELENSLKLESGMTILDFGAGSGRVSLHFLSKGFDVFAIDVSNESLKALNHTYERNQKKNWGKLTTETKLPEKPTVDAIVGADVLHHIDIASFLPKFYTALNWGGQIAFSEPNWWHFPWFIHYWSNQIPWSVEKGIMQCSYLNFCKLFKSSPFSKFMLTGHGFVPTPLLSNTFNYKLGDVMPLKLFAFRFMVWAKK